MFVCVFTSPLVCRDVAIAGSDVDNVVWVFTKPLVATVVGAVTLIRVLTVVGRTFVGVLISPLVCNEVAIVGNDVDNVGNDVDSVVWVFTKPLVLRVVGTPLVSDTDPTDGAEMLKRVLILVAVAETELLWPRFVPVGRFPVLGNATETELIDPGKFVLIGTLDVPGTETETELIDVTEIRVFTLDILIDVTVSRVLILEILVPIDGTAPLVDNRLTDGVEMLKRVLTLVAVVETELP